MSLRRRIVVGALAVLAAIVALASYVGLTAGRHLLAARDVLEVAPSELSERDINDGLDHLRSGLEGLRAPPARVLGILPLVSSNLDALEVVTRSGIKTLEAGLDLEDALRELDENGLLTDETVDLAALEGLERPFREQKKALVDSERSIAESLNGWLLPPLYEQLDRLQVRVRDLGNSAARALSVLEVAPSMLGFDGPRQYLVVLVNNAELRGAGGVLSGIGTLQVDAGRLSLGRFDSVHDLQSGEEITVPAPPEYERRFAIYKANTNLLLNTTFSADFPDVAVVAARLYDAMVGVEADGVLQLDPVGLAQLMPSDATIDVPRSDVLLGSGDIARFAYSDAYEQFRSQRARRSALLVVGREILAGTLTGGLEGRESFERLGSAFSSGHAKFVSFDHDEREALGPTGVTWGLEPFVGDDVLVTAQNFGGGGGEGSKLDYWTRRSLLHECSIGDDVPTRCATEVTLANTVPEGLSRYVAGRPYGLLRNYVEIFIPEEAEIEAVLQDGDVVEFRAEPQASREALGIHIAVPPGGRTTLRVVYSLPTSNGYSLMVTPQPLAHSASIEIVIDVPPSWSVVRGPDGEHGGDGVFSYSGDLDRVIRIEAAPQNPPGIPGVWRTVRDFWTSPVF